MRCLACHENCDLSYHFIPEPLGLFICSLLQGEITLESNLQTTFQIAQTTYNLFAYTRYHPVHTSKGIAHFSLVFYDEGGRFTYDNRFSKFISGNKQKLSSFPIVSVWLLKAE